MSQHWRACSEGHACLLNEPILIGKTGINMSAKCRLNTGLFCKHRCPSEHLHNRVPIFSNIINTMGPGSIYRYLRRNNYSKNTIVNMNGIPQEEQAGFNRYGD